MKSVDPKKLAQVLLEITEGKSEGEVQSSIKNFADFLLKKNLLSYVNSIVAEYEILYNSTHNIIEATVTTVNSLKENNKQELKEALKQKYKATEVSLKEITNKKLLGGIKIKIGDTVFDNSLQNSLYQLETQLLK